MWTSGAHFVTDISFSTLKPAGQSSCWACIDRVCSVDLHQAPVKVDGSVPVFIQKSNHTALPLTRYHDRACLSRGWLSVDICNRELKTITKKQFLIPSDHFGEELKDRRHYFRNVPGLISILNASTAPLSRVPTHRNCPP